MGDVTKRVKVHALLDRSSKGAGRWYSALVDTGATKTVVPRRLLEELGTDFSAEYSYHEGVRMPLVELTIRLYGRGCEDRVIFAIVSDELAAKAGPEADILLGHDYLQAASAIVRYNLRPHQISCAKQTRKHRRRG
jgi:predicted aspartyl protease